MANTLVYNPFTGTLDYAGAGGGGTATPDGPNGAVQFNSAGTFGGDAALTWDSVNKRVGIGIATGILAQVHTLLDVAAGGNSQHALFDQYNASNVTGPLVIGRRSRGTPSAPAAVQAGDQLLTVNARGDDGTGFVAGGRANVILAAAELWTATANGTLIDFNTTLDGTTAVSSGTPRLRIADDGSILVNTTSKIAGSKVVIAGGALHSAGALRIGTSVNFTEFVNLNAAPITYTLPSAQASAAGQVLSNNGAGVLSWTAPGSAPTGPAGGDLSGTYPNPTVARVNGALLGTTTPLVQGDLLVADATPSLARFAGNATATKQYLSMTSSVPLWTAIPGTDVTGAALTTGAADPNVTIALGGTPATALLRAASITLGWSGQLAVGRGGTGLANGTSGGILGFTGTTTLAPSALLTQHALVLGGGLGATPSTPVGLGASNQVLHGNAAGDPSFGAVVLGAGGDVTGLLPIANGGTGQGNAAAAFNGLSPLTTEGDLLFFTAGNNARLPVGAIGRYLRSDGTDPVYVNPALFDDFTQYLKLSGRTGTTNNPTISTDASATITGSAGSNLNLTLIACAGATKGLVRIQDEIRLYTSTAAIALPKFASRVVRNLNISGGTARLTALAIEGTLTQTGNTGAQMPEIDVNDTYTLNSGISPPTFFLFWNRRNIVSNVAGLGALAMNSLVHAPSFAVGGAGVLDACVSTAVLVGEIFNGGTNWVRTGVQMTDASTGATFASNIGLDYANQTGGGLCAAVRSGLTDGSTQFFLQDTGGARSEFVGKFTRYNNVPTAGWGIPGVNGFGRSTAQTAAVASVAAYTLPAADGTVLVSANVLVTTSTTHNFNVQVAYTDEGNTARTVTMNVQQLAGTFVTAITNLTGAGPYEGIPLHLRCKASTTITVKTTGTFTAVTYNVEGMIVQVA